MDKGWIQLLLVGVPVLSLIGSWLALRTVAARRRPTREHRAARPDANDNAEET